MCYMLFCKDELCFLCKEGVYAAETPSDDVIILTSSDYDFRIGVRKGLWCNVHFIPKEN